MGIFDGFRDEPAPALYGEERNPVSQDLVIVGLLVAFGMILFSFMFGILPGVAGGFWKKLSLFVRVFFATFVGAAILMGVFGDGWMSDSVTTEVYLKQFSNVEVHAKAGFHIGLLGINITLKGDPVKQPFGSNRTTNGTTVIETMEEIDYNEHYDFGELQGRLGFGPQAGIIAQEFRYAQFRGAPLPILWILEYFTIDGEDLRWGRNFRQAGYYCNLLLWSAFAFWILSVALFTTAIASACFLLGICGILIVIACGVYAGMRDQHGPPLRIPIAHNAVLEPHYGWSFALSLFTGILCIVVGGVVYYLYLRFPEFLYEFFDHDLLEEEDILEVQRTIDEGDGFKKTWGQSEGITASGDIKKVPLDGDVEAGRQSQDGQPEAYLRKSRRSKRVKSKRSAHGNAARPNLAAVTEEADEPSAGANGEMEMQALSRPKQSSSSLTDALRSSLKRKKKGTTEEETAIHEAMETQEAEDEVKPGNPEMV